MLISSKSFLGKELLKKQGHNVGNVVQGSWKLPKLFVPLKWCHYQIWLEDNQHCLWLVSKFHTCCFEQFHRKTIVSWFPFLLYVHKCMYRTAGMLPSSQEPSHVLFLPDAKQRAHPWSPHLKQRRDVNILLHPRAISKLFHTKKHQAFSVHPLLHGTKSFYSSMLSLS